MFKSALIYIIAVVTIPLFFILMTANHPNYHGQFDEGAIKIITVSGK
jgi:hypothetical protein|tara:strand:- start:3343 stop:3483 length:141 start_codon:yes stop_codon:yes gene_type:complete